MKYKSARTVLLGVFATGTLVWSAIYHFSVPMEEMAWLFAYSAMGVLIIMLLAAVAVALLQVGNSLRNKNSARHTQRTSAQADSRQDSR
jgi:hypothetical protein